MATDVEQEGVMAVASEEILSAMEIDAIGEVMNISMGSAATAVSTMLDKQVVITTPKVNVEKLGNIDNGELEPAIIVKITYTEGIEGSNVMVFRQQDMQLILNELMGVTDPPTTEFVFDELSMSAACEVMNQMMGAAATALSEFLGKPINISTPTASIMDSEHTFVDAVGLDTSEDVVSILFNMSIRDVMSTEFVSVLSCDLAKMIVGQFSGESEIPAATTAAAAPDAAAFPPAAPPPPVQQPPQMPQQPPQMPQQPPQGQMPGMPLDMQSMQGQMPQMQQPPQMPQQPPQGQMPGMPMDMQSMQGQMGQMPQQGQMPYYPYQQQPMYPYGYPPPYPQQPYPPQEHGAPRAEAVNVHSVQFPEFSRQQPDGDPLFGGNMDLIMNVPLNVEIVIGKTKRKIRDIMGFTQGTVVELEKQAGAPVDIVVNGQLIAHGDVVVIDDNFGVRITEIVGTKELLNSLEQQMQ